MSTPQFAPENVLECARSIRPYLPELVGAEAETIDHQLADLLAKAKAGDSVENQILELLESHPKTRNRAAELLAPKRVSKGYERLAGRSGAVPAQRYVCPEGDYVWSRRSVGIPIPSCPSHPELGELIPE